MQGARNLPLEISGRQGGQPTKTTARQPPAALRQHLQQGQQQQQQPSAATAAVAAPTYEVHVGWLAEAEADGHALQLACTRGKKGWVRWAADDVMPRWEPASDARVKQASGVR